MKSFFKGFAAAILGSAIFLGSLIGWVKLVQNGDENAALADSAQDAYYDALIADRLATLDLTSSVNASSADTTGAATGTSSAGTTGAATGALSADTSLSSETGADTTAPADSTVSTDNSLHADSASASSSGASAVTASQSSGKFDGAVSAAEAPAEYAAYMQQIESELAPTYAGCLRVEYLNNQILISIWENGLVDRLTKGQTNGTTNTIWNSMKVALSDISTTYTNGLQQADLPDAKVHAHLLNETDLDKIILAYTNGTLVHDGLDHE